MKSKLLIIALAIFLIPIVAIVYVGKLFLAPTSNNTPVDFLITKGSSVSLIANNLEKAGLIKNAMVFKFYVQITGKTNKIQAGEFQLSPNLSLTQIVNELKKGPKEIWVTIPEGLRREEIALKFKDTLGKDEEFLKEFLKLTPSKEGYLFPDTYLFPKTATATQIVNKLSATFEEKVGTDITLNQVIMASMLERETLEDSEKPIVAGVLYKRLANGWPLQVDATLQYAKDTAEFDVVKSGNEYWKPIFIADKEIKSNFNTYKNLGLPPAPIANAGLASIEAAITPEESEYWYYIHDIQGKIHFAKTLEEHNANVNKYLR